MTEETKDGCEGFGRVGMLPEQMTLRECGDFVKKVLHFMMSEFTVIRSSGAEGGSLYGKRQEYDPGCTGKGSAGVRYR